MLLAFAKGQRMTVDRSALGSKRAKVTGYVRVASIVLFAAGAAIASIMYALRMPYLSGTIMLIVPPVAVMVGFAGPALLLAVFSKRIARWLVPIPLAHCPACGYTLETDNTRCPECGVESHTGSDGSANEPSSDQD